MKKRRSVWQTAMQNSTATILAILLHVGVAVVLIYAYNKSPAELQAPGLTSEITAITAIAVDEAQLKAAQARLDAAEQQRIQAEKDRQARLERAAREAEEKRRREEERARELERQRVEQQKRQEQERLQAKAEAQRKAEAEAEAEAKRKAEAEAKRKAEAEAKRKAEAEAKRKAEAEAEAEAKRKAEAEAEAAARKKAEEDARRQLAESLRQRAAESKWQQHSSLIARHVERSWRLPQSNWRGLSCTLRIKISPTGRVLDVSLARTSGNPDFDRSAIAAVQRASPLPIPRDSDVLELLSSNNFAFSFIFRPEATL